MKQYEVTFIVDPVLSGDEAKATVDTYISMLKEAGAKIIHIDEMGLRQLAYPINRRNSGFYYCVEYSIESGEIINKMELSFRRDERIMRFLTVSLDKYGVQYNDDKRNGKIGKVKTKEEKKAEKKEERERRTAPKAKKEQKPKAQEVVEEAVEEIIEDVKKVEDTATEVVENKTEETTNTDNQE